MISYDEAHRSARRFLERIGYPEGLTLVMVPAETKEHPRAWAVAFDSQEHLDTGDDDLAPFTRMIVVPKDGSEPYFPPTIWSVEVMERHLSTPQ
jgi:immunity protein 35 of polymorphic toxin system